MPAKDRRGFCNRLGVSRRIAAGECHITLLLCMKKPAPTEVEAGLQFEGIASEALLVQCLFDSDSAGNGAANHRVVAHADKAHHVDVCRHGGGASKLRVRVHTTHGVGHAIGCGTSGHVVRVQGTASAATGSDGEVLLAGSEALLLVGARNGVLEARCRRSRAT